MSRVLVTGMSGVGKSTLLAGLAQRGHTVVDTDFDGWVLEDGPWDEPRMHDLLTHVGSVVVSGTVENQVQFYGYFDHVVLLSAPLQTLLDRVTERSSNPYGTSKAPARRRSTVCCSTSVSRWVRSR